MRYRIVWVVLLLCGLGWAGNPAMGQTPAEKEYEQQLKLIEGHHKVLQERYKAKLDAVDERLKLLDERFGILKKQIDARVTKTEFQSDLVSTWVGPITIVALIGAFLAIWRFQRRIPEIAEAHAKEEFGRQFPQAFERLLKEEEKKILEIIEKYDEELQLKRNKQILILSGKDADETFVRNFFEDMGFERRDFERIDTSIPLGSKDLIVFNDESGDLTEERMAEIGSQSRKDAVFFYFGSKRVGHPELVTKLSFANAKPQLYGNIMNMLRYQNFLEEREGRS